MAVRIAKGEGDAVLGLLCQPVIDERAVGRVLADIEMLAHPRAVRPLHHDRVAVDAEGGTVGDAGAYVGAGAPVELGADRRARREQPRVSTAVGEAAQRGDVVEDPERAAVRRSHQIGVLESCMS